MLNLKIDKVTVIRIRSYQMAAPDFLLGIWSFLTLTYTVSGENFTMSCILSFTWQRGFRIGDCMVAEVPDFEI